MRYVLLAPITALKNVAAGDGFVTEYASDLWALPPSMLLEAMAQAAGLLVASAIHFRAQPVLAKVQPFAADRLAVPADQVIVRAELRQLRHAGCRAHATARVGSTLLGD